MKLTHNVNYNIAVPSILNHASNINNKHIIFMLALASCFTMCASLTPSSSSLSPTRTIIRRVKPLHAVSKKVVAVLDGAEWASVQSFLSKEEAGSPSSSKPSKYGYMTVLSGTTSAEGHRVVGIQALDDVIDDEKVDMGGGAAVYKDSMATVPSKVSFDDTISTLCAALSGVHFGIPRIENVGGGEYSFVSPGKVVVMGGSNYAKFFAEALAAFGGTVFLVTTRKGVRLKNDRVTVMEPSTGEMQLGFSAVLGKFDSLVDTMTDETNSFHPENDGNDDGFYGMVGGSAVTALLKQVHNCDRYLSTFPRAQQIVRDSGVLFGPKKAEAHQKELVEVLSSSRVPPSATYQRIVPPKGFSVTIQTLLDNRVLYSGDFKKDVSVRGWALQDFWELASWPRDSSGSNVRFGLPALDEFDDQLKEDGVMISAPPLVDDKFARGDNNFAMDNEEEIAREGQQSNPFVMDISDVAGLQEKILANDGKDCIVFMSAPWCRTCRKLSPAYTRMARETANNNENVVFAKANTAGTKGKQLGKALEVDAVPTFLLFRGGKRFGNPLSLSRLPSKKLDLAMEFLTSGSEWDTAALRELDSEDEDYE